MATKKIKKQNQKDNDAFSGVEEYIAARESDLGDYETIALDKTPVSEEQSLQKDVIYDNMKIELEHKTNPSLDGVYETLQTLKIEENSNNVSKCIRTREAKQKVLMFVLVMMAVAASITSLVITLMNTNKVLAVDGSWASWESWEACSSTCDYGMQKRQRNCSNPRPLGTGQYCVGLATEHRLCTPGPCLILTVDGSWASWESWEACSRTCDLGMQKRQRNCSNPRPLGAGQYCIGVESEHRLCAPGPCLNGGWSAWGVWSECSATCDGGLKSRSRACNNPKPSLFGDFCEGENMQQEMCSNKQCNEMHVAFSVYETSAIGSNSSSMQKIIFTTILFNEGEVYNKTIGTFVAPFSGLYQFNAHICVGLGKTANYALVREGRSFASGEFMTMADATDGKCTSFSAVAVVQSQEKVWVESHNLFQNSNDWNAFSGILIHRT